MEFKKNINEGIITGVGIETNASPRINRLQSIGSYVDD